MKEALCIPYTRVTTEQLTPLDKQLKEAATRVAQDAYAPYSHFRVGAAVCLKNGEIITGSNQENAAYPSGICAERTALFYAAAQYPDVGVETLAIVAFNQYGQVEGISPCGACRQVLMETTQRFGPYRVLLCGREECIILEDARYLLPFGFDGSSLITE